MARLLYVLGQPYLALAISDIPQPETCDFGALLQCFLFAYALEYSCAINPRDRMEETQWAYLIFSPKKAKKHVL
mgnify:CR=1 FL=1